MSLTPWIGHFRTIVRECRVAIKGVKDSTELDSDEGLEATLRRELVEIALSNGIRDVETLRDILLDALSGE